MKAQFLAVPILMALALVAGSVQTTASEPPTITCGHDKDVQCGDAWAFDIPTAVNNCVPAEPGVVIEVVATVTNVAVPRCPALFSVTRTWRASDACGNSAFCNQTVTVVDTEPPNLTCGPDKEAQCGTDWFFDIPTAVDKCDLNNVLIEVVATVTNTAIPRCPRIFSVTRTFRSSDTCGNSAFCNQTVTVVDTEPPNITCEQDKEVQCGTDWAFDIPTAVDKCDLNNVLIEVVATVTNIAAPRCPRIFSVTRTFRSSDTCGNSAFCNQTVTVVDTEPPNLTCGPNKEVQCGTDWAFDIPTAVDKCDLNNVIIEVVATVTNTAIPRCPKIFSVTRTFRSSDTCGNSAFCNQTVTVVDTEPPNLTCGPNKDVQCGTDWAFDIPTAVDKCDLNNVIIEVVATVTNTAIPRCPKIFSVTRTFRSSDTCGNSAFCNQTVTVVDTEPPNLTCGPNKDVQCGTDWAFDIPTAVDKCDLNNVLIEVVATVTNTAIPRCPRIFSVTRTWRSSDTCGNSAFCNQTVTIVDTEPPNLTCGPDKEVQCGTDWFFDIPTAVDKCDLNNVLIEVVATVTNVAVPRCPRIFSVTRTWRSSDTCGNSAFCNQTVTIVDTEPPKITCEQDKEVQCGTDWAFDIPTAVDKCDLNNVLIQVVSTVTNIAVPRCPRIFSVTRTWRSSDTCGNSSFCNQTVTIVDTTPPNLTCAHDQIVECGNQFAFTRPTAYDVCDGTNVVIEITSTTTNISFPRCPNLFTVRRTWRATDTCGNESFCSQTLTIVDTTPPNLTCAHDQIVECGNQFAFTRPTAYDVCDGTNVVIEITSTTTNVSFPRCPNLFTVRRTWRAIDTCGNESFCSQTLTIVDTTPPNLTCADDQIVECGNQFAFTRPTAYDVCDGTNVVIEITSTTTNIAFPRCPNLFTVRRTWRATDTCGNESFCSQTLTIVDTTPPNLTCADDQIVECGNQFAFTRPTAYDVCDGTNVVIEITSTTTNIAFPRCPNLFTVRRTWRATDTCGNESFCSQTLTIVDTTPPNLTCADDQIVECGNQFAFTRPTAYDVCDGTNVVIEITSTTTNIAFPRCPNLFTVRRTWRATDTCGNESFCSQTLTIVDTTPPNIHCTPDKEVQWGDDASFDRPTAVDVCDGTNVVIEITSTVTNVLSPRCPALFSARRTWRAIDTCGNASFCSQTITFIDTLPPDIHCAPDKEAQCGANWSFDRPTAVDKCDGTNVVIEITSTVTNVLAQRCPALFSATRTWRAIDTCGNVSFCNQTVTIVDTEPPDIFCGSDRIVQCGIPWNFTAPTAVDICDGANVTITVVSTVTNGLCGRTFSAMRTWRVIDSCSNSATCSQAVLVVDTLPPTIICAPDRVVECGAHFSFTPPSANDICDGTNVTVVVVATETNALCGMTFFATRTWGAVDRCGNMAFCSQTITVVDTIPPTITCAPDKTVECAESWSFDEPTATDMCGPVTNAIVSTVTNIVAGGTNIATRCWKAIDGCGNMSMVCCQSVFIKPCPALAGCRVTGGGNHQTNMQQSACITTPLPTFVSHGGQVGAPFSVGTPWTPNSPCIRGEWQHNRHLNGNSLVGLFHASGNGHESQFDSLLCACLPCDDKPNSQGMVGDICNPGDRVCGPHPPRSPANKICFSGVGDYTLTTGRKTIKAVFRVDIEDRSEGNSHSSSRPPDRYRIRLWLLDPSCGRNPDPDSAEAMTLRWAASADPTRIANVGTTEDLRINIPPDIDDGGEMTQGNHQIHKATGATCTPAPLPPAPRIDVAAEIACQTAAGTCTFGTTAQGLKFPMNVNPVFNYRLSITNSGTVILTNLSVWESTNSVWTDVTRQFFVAGAMLPPGGSVMLYRTNAWSEDTVDTLIVYGNSEQDGTLLSLAATAVASVQAELQLSIRRAGGTIILEWPPSAPAGLILEGATSLGLQATWTTISSHPANPFVTTNAPINGARFYRLRMP